MRVTIRLFARLRELAGAAEFVRDLPAGATVRTAWEELVAEFPSLGAYTGSISSAVNAEYAKPETPLASGDEVAFLPPVSGGATRGDRAIDNRETGDRLCPCQSVDEASKREARPIRSNRRLACSTS